MLFFPDYAMQMKNAKAIRGKKKVTSEDSSNANTQTIRNMSKQLSPKMD